MLHRILCAFALSAVLTAPILAEDAHHAESPAPADPVVARVNGVEIHRADVAELLLRMPEQVRQLPIDTIFPLLVNRLVEQELVSAEGYKAKLQDRDEVKRIVKKAEALAVQQIYIRDAVKAKITDAALQEAYKTYLAENPAQEEVEAAHILVKTEQQAKAIIASLKKGADFAKLAEAQSQDPGSAKKGGDLGWFGDGVMVEPFSKAAFALKTGEITQAPVKTDYGWHVIKLSGRRIKPQPGFDEVKAHLEETVADHIAEGLVKDLRAKAKIETFDINGNPPAPAPNS